MQEIQNRDESGKDIPFSPDQFFDNAGERAQEFLRLEGSQPLSLEFFPRGQFGEMLRSVDPTFVEEVRRNNPNLIRDYVEEPDDIVERYRRSDEVLMRTFGRDVLGDLEGDGRKRMRANLITVLSAVQSEDTNESHALFNLEAGPRLCKYYLKRAPEGEKVEAKRVHTRMFDHNIIISTSPQELANAFSLLPQASA